MISTHNDKISTCPISKSEFLSMKRREGDLIVVGTHTDTSIGAHLLGSTA
jgi:hypothetical protein